MDAGCISQSTSCAGSVGDCSAASHVLLFVKPPGRGCCHGSYKEVLPGPGGYDWTFASSSPVTAMPHTGVTLIRSGRIPGTLHSKELVLLCILEHMHK